MTLPLFSSPESELPRDRWGRPLITPPDGSEPVAYRRVTTLAGTLDDTYNLQKWGKRMVAKGVAISKDLQLAAAAADPDTDKRTLDEITEAAVTLAGGGAKARVGTAIHSFSEKIDRGEDLGYVPDEYLPDLEAYKRATKDLQVLAIETFCVLDEYRIGGTYDRLYGLGGAFTAPDGSKPDVVIGDLKTGNIDFGAGKMAMQLSAYSRSLNYDHRDGSRSPIADGRVDQSWGVIVNVAAGTGTATLHWIDLAAGAVGLAVAAQVMKYRDGSRDLLTRFVLAQSTSATPPSLTEQLHAAKSVTELRDLARQHALAWTPGLTTLAKQIIAERSWA